MHAKAFEARVRRYPTSRGLHHRLLHRPDLRKDPLRVRDRGILFTFTRGGSNLSCSLSDLHLLPLRPRFRCFHVRLLRLRLRFGDGRHRCGFQGMEVPPRELDVPPFP